MGSSISSPLHPQTPLPAGWIEPWNRVYQHFYFLETQSGMTHRETPQQSGKNKSLVGKWAVFRILRGLGR
ncbi:hypothetical protein BJX66DRAFT_320464 [Aspergillus keveii]|uniref:Uncharacterized protein n=1 Tax=Aspergillus keveii TaxID=714993 RepID=A0ABR4FH28_9EURO